MALDFMTIVEWATIIVAFVLMGSVLPLCLNMYKKKSTTNVPYLMFLISDFLTIMSLQYGIMINNQTLILINCVGAIVWGAYTFIYILVSREKSSPLLMLFGFIGLYFASLYYFSTLPPADYMSAFGKYMMAWCLIISLVPAGEIITIVKEKSTNCCNLPIMFGATLNVGVWCLYGCLLNDINIYLPTVPGLVVNLLKFFLLLVYGLPSDEPASIEAISKDRIYKDFDNSINNGKAGEALRKRK